jgi:hypothetical protein
MTTSLPAYRIGLPSACGASCGFPPALSVMEIQSTSGRSTSAEASRRTRTADSSTIEPRTLTSSTPTRKRGEASRSARVGTGGYRAPAASRRLNASTTRRMAAVCSGVLPQHDPTMWAPASSTSGTAAAISDGVCL